FWLQIFEADVGKARCAHFQFRAVRSVAADHEGDVRPMSKHASCLNDELQALLSRHASTVKDDVVRLYSPLGTIGRRALERLYRLDVDTVLEQRNRFTAATRCGQPLAHLKRYAADVIKAPKYEYLIRSGDA